MSDYNIGRALLATDETERDKYLYREVIKFAVQRQMFCQHCQAILDMKKTTLVERTDGSTFAILCSKCVDMKVGSQGNKTIAELCAEKGFKVTDARELYRKPRAKEVRHEL